MIIIAACACAIGVCIHEYWPKHPCQNRAMTMAIRLEYAHAVQRSRFVVNLDLDLYIVKIINILLHKHVHMNSDDLDACAHAV